MQNQIDQNKILYVRLILDLSYEIGISPREAKKIVDTALQYVSMDKINFNELRNEILSFIIINMFSLICKLK